MSKAKVLFLPIVVLVLLAIMAGCGSPTKTPSSTAPATAEPAYASAITDETLMGLTDDSLAEYTRYGDEQFKAAVTQEMLDTVSTQIKNQLGDYVSKTYVSTETQDVYTIVHYRAKYTKGEVGVRMVFDADQLVAGQFFE